MNNANVISVNPGIKTMGELNIDEITLSRISRTLSNPGQTSSTFKNILNGLFGINSMVTNRWSVKLASVRIIAGVIMLATGISSLTGMVMSANSGMIGIAATILGASLILGLFSRILSIGAVGVSVVILAESLTAGTVDQMALTMAMVGAIMAIVGPGHYSLDQILRRSLFKLYRNRNRHDPDRDPAKIAFDYSAFASVDIRLR
ncbi:MAG: hypothetical protein K2G67_01755 [Muribaculaceae bacterium]|nr:hypothetical protein [Muribaculaceae bacterium]